MHHPTERITHTTAFVTRRGALAGTRNSSMGYLLEVFELFNIETILILYILSY